jgi:hypothetical protein
MIYGSEVFALGHAALFGEEVQLPRMVILIVLEIRLLVLVGLDHLAFLLLGVFIHLLVLADLVDCI